MNPQQPDNNPQHPNPPPEGQKLEYQKPAIRKYDQIEQIKAYGPGEM